MQLHRDVFAGLFPDVAGRWRVEVIDVAGDSCCDPAVIGARMADVCGQLHEQLDALEGDPYDDEERFAKQVELAAWTHVELLACHPFIDGNGRIARLLLNIMLKRFDLLPVNIRIEDGYLVHLRAAIRHEPAGLVAMLTRLISSAAEEFEELIAHRERVARQQRRRRSRRR